MDATEYDAGFAAYSNGNSALPPEGATAEWLRGFMDARTESYRHGGSLYPNANPS